MLWDQIAMMKIDSKSRADTSMGLARSAKQADMAALDSQGAADSGSGKTSGTILLADDEESVLSVCSLMLSTIGFQVMTATDGQEAVELFSEHADEISCVLLDLTMPYLDGAQVLREIRQIRPEVKVILSSGYDEDDINTRYHDLEAVNFIQKPFELATLEKRLREVLSAPVG
jgi:CheY-like chemotaxis protein